MNRNIKGRSLELFFIDGNPKGMLTAEVFNWTGHVLMTPRTSLKEALKRKESSYTGVYLLLGENEEGDLLYVGEAENISERIKNHDAKKDWWSEAVFITSAANNLNKAHVKYLESRLHEIAKTIGKVTLENANIPGQSSLTEADITKMEGFIEELLLVLPAIRIDSFVQNTRLKKDVLAPEENENSIHFELTTPKHGIHAFARLEDGDFIVESGSIARNEWSSVSNHSYKDLRNNLVETGIIKQDGNLCLFTQDYAFRSTSAAAAIVNGRPSNGTVEWKLKGTAKTYKDWEAETVQNIKTDLKLD